MLDTKQKEDAAAKVYVMLEKAGIVITENEKDEIEYAEFGLGRFKEFGLALIVYINTRRVCAKELVMLPEQICPEHRHPPVANKPGKEETFRCRWGEVFLYVPGPNTVYYRANIPADKKEYFSVWNEIILRPGEQYTLAPNTLHWFQAGPQGAVISEFSTTSRDESDIFTDPELRRLG